MALATLNSLEIYSGFIVDEKPSTVPGEPGLICVEEPVSPVIRVVPDYISTLERYTERECRDICRQLTNCIRILHESGVAHRNLHVENVLVDPFVRLSCIDVSPRTESPSFLTLDLCYAFLFVQGQVSIRGLRYSQPISDDQPLTGHFGYYYSWYAFKAPEVDIDFVHSKAVDLWSLGATMYMLLTGLPPFRGNGMELIQTKHAGLIDFDIVIPSASAQRLVHGLLEVEQERRYTIDDVLIDEWMNADGDYLSNFTLEIAHDGLKDWKKTQ
jgi:serine/threonine protein kinase